MFYPSSYKEFSVEIENLTVDIREGKKICTFLIIYIFSEKDFTVEIETLSVDASTGQSMHERLSSILLQKDIGILSKFLSVDGCRF